jgi:SHAQKYF class myb-like DNA-binding protein
MQQKINSLGVDEFQTSDITNSKTPNNIENPSTNASQYNKVYQNQFIKIDTSNISKNNNSPNYISDEYLNITDKRNSNNDQENDINNNSQFHTGRWTEEEHRKFIDGILEYGNEWKKVQQIIKTRSSTQALSHAQKFFLRVKKVIKNNGGSFNINEKDKIIECIVVNFLPDRKEQPLTKSQKEKLLSAVSSNIKYEGELKENSDEDFQKVMDEDNLKYRKASNNDLGNKNYIDCRSSIIDIDENNKKLVDELFGENGFWNFKTIMLESEEYKKYFDAFEESFVFSSTANPTGILKECRNYAEANGTVYKKKVEYSDTEIFDYYEPNDPTEYRIIVLDHIGIIDLERGMNKKEAIDKTSEYLAKYLRNRYGFTSIVIQQQNTSGESNDSVKLGRIRPSGAGLADS